ncbi:hypothetical protein [Pseudonocardia alaniniphila]|uniref:DUF4145 domain-containing protein n=1 Tax=Pseudonocardia alaniniphila TaxID=75291 RepID=A0ABS9T9V0_9PSEU|nr:hypothetical protein [Pseudonocardia alaniniphila]MCH6165310.1 hypothetical protein [Pseudonocardia alaniniphila]
MSGFELISNIATAALWPLVILLLGIMFRDTLKSVVERITKLEAFGANIEIAKSVEKLDAAADSVELDAAIRDPKHEEADKGKGSNGSAANGSFVAREAPLRHLVEVAKLSPAAAIVDAWREVENNLLSYWQAAKTIRELPEEKYQSAARIAQILRSFKMITPQQYELLNQLRSTRNEVAHGQGQPSEGQSLAYLDAAGLAIKTLAADRRAIKRGEFDVPARP